MLAMYNLSLEGTGRQGYFRWKEDICAFIGRHWNFLLGTRSHVLILLLTFLTSYPVDDDDDVMLLQLKDNSGLLECF